ncbi:hypothetical protein UPYG_G00147640 [Umbra pygmaea]|uniref:G patch domain-containing protein 4 n=1 Tax=Umbra pygmaea TaxID=75934 RepID=A0ABD0X135_UMBPY
MAECLEKSHGLKFAEQQLLRHGWKQGKGLGRQEDGISEPIKVKVKCDKGGMGHHQGKQFTFHWWDHVFNKAASNLEVESDKNGVQLNTLVKEEEKGMISNKKPRKANLGRDKLYGSFVKSATLLAGMELKSSSKDESSSDDEDQKLDLSSSTKLSDDDLMKACGGRTAHKGARHGLTMSAKLARLEQQEQEFMEKYGKKNQKVSTTLNKSTILIQPTAKYPNRENELGEETQGKKKRKNRSGNHENMFEENVDAVVSKCFDMELKIKKNRKKKHLTEDTRELAVIPVKEQLMCVEDATTDDGQTTKRKRSKKSVFLEEGVCCHVNRMVSESAVIFIESDVEGGSEEAFIEDTCEGATLQEIDSETTRKKKKKKKKKNQENLSSKYEEETVDMENINDTNANQSKAVEDSPPKKKRKKSHRAAKKREEPEIKKKKKRKDKCTVEDQALENM